MKFKKSILFYYNNNEHFLFQAMNFGKHVDELKFSFNDPKTGTHLIHNRKTGIIDKLDIMNKYGELTYHADGSFLFKFPNYPLKDKIHINTSAVGNRRKPLNDIKEWEPIFHYEVFRYDACKRYKAINPKEKYALQNDIFFNGISFGCVVSLVNKNHYTYPTHNEDDSIYIRIEGVTKELDLCLAFGKLKEKGRILYMSEIGKEIFVNNNYLRIVEKKTDL